MLILYQIKENAERLYKGENSLLDSKLCLSVFLTFLKVGKLNAKKISPNSITSCAEKTLAFIGGCQH